MTFYLGCPIWSELIAGKLGSLGLKNVHIEGQVQPYSINHNVGDSKSATNDCETCHTTNSRVTESILLADSAPAGITPEFVSGINVTATGSIVSEDGALYYRPINENAETYIFGHNRIAWIDWFGAILFLGTVAGVAGHGTIRFVIARRRGMPKVETKSIYMYEAYERFWHWLQTAAIVLLLLTGLVIHRPDLFGAFAFANIVIDHNVLAALLAINAFISILWHFISGEIQQYIPHPYGFILPGLIAGAGLLADYVLTVAVSTASGVAAITSAFPALFPHRVAICVSFVILVMVANLRGIRDTGQIFAVPTYWFIGCLALLVGGGFYHLLAQGPRPPPEAVAAQEPLTIFLVLRAFSGGCAALTGTEAVANGLQYFRPPESRNAGITLVWMASILALSFLGVTFLAHYYHIVPRAEETVVSMLARELFGRGWVYYMIQAATAVILLLAVNTSFAGFPMLASIMAKDGFLPRQFANFGDRLVFSNGILILAGLSCLLLVIFGGSTHALIPLYAIGVFTAFTLPRPEANRFPRAGRAPLP